MRLAICVVLAGALCGAQTLKVGRFAAETRQVHGKAQGLPSEDVRGVAVDAKGRVVAMTAGGAAVWDGKSWTGAAAVPYGSKRAVAADGRVAEARAEGLFLKKGAGAFERVLPASGGRSWAPVDVRAVAFDEKGRLWFASPQGVGVEEGGKWTLYTGAEGLPYDDFTSMAAGGDGSVWFGTKIGAIRFDGKNWEYRQGARWLADDEVRGIAVERDGTAWIATAKGLTQLLRTPMTLAEKARFFEENIDKRHRRTPYEYVHPVHLKRAGDTSEWTQTDSDNDGLWTSMYGAGQCFAYAATGDEKARARAKKAFEALRFLGTVTQGGEHAPPKGFVARSILPVSGPDPNVRDSKARDERQQKGERRWKVLEPRWPKSADGKWYWKTDTSSDELDGHFFFYALYYDLVAKTEAERAAVREHVGALAGHLLEHHHTLVDHDGKPTRWGYFNPEELNHNRDWWQERGMNSLSILAYYKVAWHITGDERFARAAKELIEKHGYGMNGMIQKTHLGFGAGNQSDDEMIFMNYYSLLKYETDQDLRMKWMLGFRNHWQNEKPEMNPVFNYLYAAVGRGAKFEDAYGEQQLSPDGEWLEDSADTLKRIPLDQIDWAVKNSHRKDVVLLPEHVHERGRMAGTRVNGKVLPVDERQLTHWNHDPWNFNQGGSGRGLGDGAVFLLPYYMGLYYKFIEE